MQSELISITDSIDTRTAVGRLVLNVMGSVAQWEREVTSERTKDSAHALAAENDGWIWGAPPFGLQFGPRDGKGRKTLIPHSEEHETIELIRRWAVEEKLSIGKIIDRLHALGRGLVGYPVRSAWALC